jgi:hypothetical protein
MEKNGTTVLLHHNGQPIAVQQGLSLSINDSIIDITSKESAGWFDGFSGMKDAKISFKALFSTGLMTDNPAVLSAKNLADSLIAKDRILMTITDIGFPIVGELLTESLSFDMPSEKAGGLSGSARVKGKLYALTGTMAQMLTDPDGGGTNYNTLTVSGIKITSAINTGGVPYCNSNTISVVNGGVYKVALYLTLNSGQVPAISLWDNTSANISNLVALTAGLNIVTLICTSTDASASLRFKNTADSNFSTSDIYLFKD